jgi:hypothetical protein
VDAVGTGEEGDEHVACQVGDLGARPEGLDQQAVHQTVKSVECAPLPTGVATQDRSAQLTRPLGGRLRGRCRKTGRHDRYHAS